MELTVIDYDHGIVFQHSNGQKYRGKVGGCGEALKLYDMNDNYLTTVPVADEYYESGLDPETLEIAAVALDAIAIKQWMKRTLPVAVAA